ncbi:unnamed protein product [Phytophthora lilii]|uniref:Unnamed protein product n=1 Tax=Phytophthora lilii TaxID=2077276 RepID=A0A9W6TE36_9STRA|nr:unnamed protein product [Phytophthora lilii]
MRSRVKQADVHEPSSEAQQERLPPTASVDEDGTMNTASLSERILEERLLRALRVKTESTATRHKYLQEKTHCYLSLDSTKLVSKRQELTEADILERVGRICSDIVAACCYVLDVEGVGDLTRCVERAQELSNVSITYQEFVERIEKLLKRFDKVLYFLNSAEVSSTLLLINLFSGCIFLDTCPVNR